MEAEIEEVKRELDSLIRRFEDDLFRINETYFAKTL